MGVEEGFSREPISTHELRTWGWSVCFVSLGGWTWGVNRPQEGAFPFVPGQEVGAEEAYKAKRKAYGQTLCACARTYVCCVRMCVRASGCLRLYLKEQPYPKGRVKTWEENPSFVGKV